MRLLSFILCLVIGLMICKFIHSVYELYGNGIAKSQLICITIMIVISIIFMIFWYSLLKSSGKDLFLLGIKDYPELVSVLWGIFGYELFIFSNAVASAVGSRIHNV